MLLTGCAGSGRLPDDLVQARTALAQALDEGQRDQIASAARVADRWRGRDPELDRLLGHVLSNVLMKPDDGLPLLEGSPAPEDDRWKGWVAGAALRAGDYGTMERVQRGLSLDAVDLLSPVVEQFSMRARMDPDVGWGDMVDAVRRCALLDAQPRRGRLPLERVAPVNLPATALVLGAERVVVGRPERLDDHDPLSGTGNVQCTTGRLVDELQLPTPLPRNLTIGATQDGESLYIGVKPSEGTALAYATNDAMGATRWLDAADALADIPYGVGWPGVDALPSFHQRFGAGLHPKD